MMKNFMIILNQLLCNNVVSSILSTPELPLEYFLDQKYPKTPSQKRLEISLSDLDKF